MNKKKKKPLSLLRSQTEILLRSLGMTQKGCSFFTELKMLANQCHPVGFEALKHIFGHKTNNYGWALQHLNKLIKYVIENRL
jgi:hypothetical protein